MKIALALGGGGAKGNAHIGVLRVLEREGFEVGALAGTSMGGLVGAVYLSGLGPDEIEARFSGIDQSQLLGRYPDEGPAVLGLGEVDRLLTNLLGDLTFEELPCPFAVTAVDLVKGQSVILRQGRVVDAIMSTIALPGIFPPRKWGELELVDGGLINPVPVGLARSLAPNLPVVAVSLNRPPRADVDDFAGSPLPALDRLSRWRLAQALQVVLRSIDISGRLLTELRLEVDQPEVIIRPQVYHIGLLDRVDVSEVAALGEQAAEEALDELRAVVSLPRRLARTLRPVNLLSRLNRNDS